MKFSYVLLFGSFLYSQFSLADDLENNIQDSMR